ncbi:MAG: ABC transporter permease [Candidatus Micrarchaeota archaeon]|nr:ABC transporter permease [Candidatus Micrarchaeota archaeon]
MGLSGVYAIWLREIKVFIREKERVISSFVSPLLWLFIFGGGISGSIGGESGYQEFIFPGILTMSILFSSIFFGVYIIWDRKLDFLKEVLVAPVSRSTVFFGKLLGGMTDAMIHGIILLLLGYIFIVQFPLISFLPAILIMLLITWSMVSLGLVIGANMSTQEGFGLVQNFVIWPLFFFSGALFDVSSSNLPDFIKTISHLDPLTYGVDALRTVIIGEGAFPILLDISVLVVFGLVCSYIGIISFGRMQQIK